MGIPWNVMLLSMAFEMNCLGRHGFSTSKSTL